MKTRKKSFALMAAITIVTVMLSCNKVKDGKVITDDYTGNVNVFHGKEPDGDFTGNGDSGIYAFGWQNNQKKAELNFDITTPTGSVQFILEDADKKEVLNKTRSAGGNDTFSGVSDSGTPGVWKVTMIFKDFDGDGSYSMEPID